MSVKHQTAAKHSDPLSFLINAWSLEDYGPAPGMDTLIEAPSSKVALLGRDFPGSRLDVLVEEGDTVTAGAVVMRDHRHPEIAFTTPAAGRISRIRRGARRSLQSLEIQVSDDQLAAEPLPVKNPGADDIRRLMLESGIWSSLRTRPYGYLPLPQAVPAALFVNAMDSRPLAPDPIAIINRHADWFEKGLSALTCLCESPVFLCVAPETSLPLPNDVNIRIAEFAGLHPAGLPGIHVQSCYPVGNGTRQIWQIEYSDVLSLGRLLLEGLPWQQRFVSVAGPGFAKPCLVSALRGSVISAMTAACEIGEDVQLFAGSFVDGRFVHGTHEYLGQLQHQVTALPASDEVFDNAVNEAWPLIPTADLDRHAPPGILAAPLLRALLVGDVDRARQLGALELLEDDLAGLSAVCSTGTNFGVLLRQVLESIARDEI